MEKKMIKEFQTLTNDYQLLFLSADWELTNLVPCSNGVFTMPCFLIMHKLSVFLRRFCQSHLIGLFSGSDLCEFMHK